MNRIKKRSFKILCVVLVLIFNLAPLTLTTFAVEYEGTCGENLTWFFDDETGMLTISGNGPMIDFYDGNKPWQHLRDDVVNIVVSSGVTSISRNAFSDFYELINVTIAGTVEVIEDYAFYYCENMQNVTFSEGLKHIGNSAFEGIMELSVVSIPDSVLTIGDYAFYDCECLRELKISKNVQSIGEYAFAFSSYLQTIFIDESNEFYCTVDNVLFNEDKTTLIQYPINNRKTSYVIPETVTTISDYAFFKSNYLTDVTVPGSVKYIGESVFDSNEYPLIIHYTGTPGLWEELITNVNENNDTLLGTTPHYCINQGAQAATCQNEGYSDGWYCEECEKYIIEPQQNGEIDRDNHNFDENGNCVCGATEDIEIDNNLAFPELMNLLDIIINFIQIIFNLLF